jgi:phospholipid/cholesterol/gamma-HCH transport system permease protein
VRGFVAALGAAVRRAPANVGATARVARTYARACVRVLALPASARTAVVRGCLAQVWFTAVQVLPLVLAISVLFAAALMLASYGLLRELGAAGRFGDLLRLGVAGELGPLLAGMILAARSGTAITADVGGMVLRNEIDALRVHGVDPLAWVVAPRLVAVTLSGALVTLAMVGAVYAGCVIVAPPLGVPVQELLSTLATPLGPWDVSRMLAKALCFGASIAFVTVRAGLEVKRDARELPRAGSRAVVTTILVLFVTDVLITAGMA